MSRFADVPKLSTISVINNNIIMKIIIISASSIFVFDFIIYSSDLYYALHYAYYHDWMIMI
jgi:hypothetical protein